MASPGPPWRRRQCVKSVRRYCLTGLCSVSESRHDFDAVYNGFEKELKPQGIIERMYVTEAACIVWDIVRFRSCRVALVNSAFRDALEEVLRQVLGPLRRYHSRDDEFENEEMVEANDEEDPEAGRDTLNSVTERLRPRLR